jgi:ankyrin repeat protein
MRHIDLEVRGRYNDTVLEDATWYGTGEHVKILLAMGALPWRTNQNPWQHEWSLMHMAIEANNVSVVAVLLEIPCFSHVDQEDYLGWSMLHHAARRGRSGIVSCLLGRGAEEVVPEDAEVG